MKHCKPLIILFLLGFATFSNAQFSRHIISFKDKGGNIHSLSNPSTYLSAKAIERRTKYNIPFDSTDLPITKRYLDSISAVPNVIILNRSKWLNAITIQTTDAAALSKIQSFPFVKNASPIAARINTTTVPSEKFNETYTQNVDVPITGRTTNNFYQYGASANQVQIHEGEFLHNKGFRGDGMMIAVLDAGFSQYPTNPAFDSVRLNGQILGTWDYVSNNSNVADDHEHGMYVWSTMASNQTGVFVGSAPKAKYWLFRTEDVFSEYPIEEINWVAGAEFADSAGSHMINSALGYHDFDNASFNYTYAQMDGNTTYITRGADFAAKKGMIVINSAGNAGNDSWKFILAPADGDSVVAVGAVDVNGNIASFSSYGPNSKGKTKPNIVSVGQGTTIAWFNGQPFSGNGTSFAAPNIAGLIGCLWQAFPDFSNMEIINAVQKSAHKFNNPDDRFGYGIPNFRVAFNMLTDEREKRSFQSILGEQFMKVYPNPIEGSTNVLIKGLLTGKINLRIFDASGKSILTRSENVVKDQFSLITIDNLGRLNSGVYYVQYEDGTTSKIIPLIKR